LGQPGARYRVNGLATDVVSVADRGLAYGDGLFETIALINGQPSLWAEHMKRLIAGCRVLAMPQPDTPQLHAELCDLAQSDSGVGKIVLTRGNALPGYRPAQQARPNRILQFFPNASLPPRKFPDPVRVRMCTTRLSINTSTAGMKHLNRLEQVLARAEWHDEAIAEGLMMDTNGNLIEGVSSNLFLLEADGGLCTPTLEQCGVSGVMRSCVMEVARSLGMTVIEAVCSVDRLWAAPSAFLTNALTGIRPIAAIDDHQFKPHLISGILQESVWNKSFMSNI
jgi:4-amino-4-deoxychorismate lyase